MDGFGFSDKDAVTSLSDSWMCPETDINSFLRLYRYKPTLEQAFADETEAGIPQGQLVADCC